LIVTQLFEERGNVVEASPFEPVIRVTWFATIVAPEIGLPDVSVTENITSTLLVDGGGVEVLWRDTIPMNIGKEEEILPVPLVPVYPDALIEYPTPER
jgi:hypothetical protein